MEDGFDDTSSFAFMTLDEKLIELVRSHKVLYNKHCSGYRDVEKKQESWNEIGEQLDTTSEECMKRWTSIRERYSRELRRLDQLSESKGHVVISWPYFPMLSFLKEFVKPRNPRSAYKEKISWDSPAPPKKFKHFNCESNDFPDEKNSPPTARNFKSFSGEMNEFTDTRDSSAPTKKLKIFSGETSEFSDGSNPLEEVCLEKLEMPIEIGNVQLHASRVNAHREKFATKKVSGAIQSFGQTVAALISEMSEAKQAKAMRVLFDALISIKTEPEET